LERLCGFWTRGKTQRDIRFSSKRASTASVGLARPASAKSVHLLQLLFEETKKH
jgi:hypothetical protein